MLKLMQPVNGPITQEFGENTIDYSRWGYPGHNGRDYGVPIGTPVKAAAAGRVLRVAYEDGGYGNYVVIDHGAGFTGYYAHLLAQRVRPGEQVGVGDEIGLSGKTGATTGPHLHFGLKGPGGDPRYKGYIDPAPYFYALAQPSGPAPITADNTGALDLGGLRFRLTSEYLNVRSGPGIGFPVVARLARGDIIAGKRLHCVNAWVEFDDGKFAAYSFGGEDYLEPVGDE